MDSWGYYNRECASFVAWRLHARNGFEMPRAIGNAGTWGAWFAPRGYAVDSSPAVGAIAESSGHVAWVEAVNGDGTVTVEEYNQNFQGAYGERTVAASTFHYIHAKDITAAPGGGSVGTSEYSGRDYLGPDQRLYPNQYLTSTDGRHVLILQGDGNLVLYGPGYHALWSTGTSGRSVHSLLMQGDGNLVLYGTGGQGALWASNTAGRGSSTVRLQDDGNTVLYAGGGAGWSTGTASGAAGLTGVQTDRLAADARLYPGQFLRSSDGRYRLALQSDGNLVLYSPGYRVLWASGTAGRSAHSLLMQADANLVLYGTGSQGALWSSNRTGAGTFAFTLQSDGNGVVYGSSGAVWATGTGGLT
ncbi:CHAP domain-containing protein [Amycolatopsis sp. OK19-0408]|uniref:CHAP domain-containing protein n=1 Tax=Amycolatopsis iheyensis TaxID=2945988 RepID=A0A9X2N7C8_9PSEU|nr:CHAP domain-containing protein [Amycolatopsis iheyensis]MCR6483314.1 CHAP domain-containing protein [Amycolatopsis iheyensis]